MKKELEHLTENTQEKGKQWEIQEKLFFPVQLEFEMKTPFQNFKILP